MCCLQERGDVGAWVRADLGAGAGSEWCGGPLCTSSDCDECWVGARPAVSALQSSPAVEHLGYSAESHGL